MKPNSFLAYIGGSVTRAAGGWFVTGLFIVIYGAAPGQAVAHWLTILPNWLLNPWLKLALVPIGLFVIFISLRFNIWSLRQKKIDALAEDLSWAIHHLLNEPVGDEDKLVQWEAAFRKWCDDVTEKLTNRAFFTRADELHFSRLGLVPPINFAGSFNARHRWLVDQLGLKFDRLRDVINWAQMRPR